MKPEPPNTVTTRRIMDLRISRAAAVRRAYLIGGKGYSFPPMNATPRVGEGAAQKKSQT